MGSCGSTGRIEPTPILGEIKTTNNGVQKTTSASDFPNLEMLYTKEEATEHIKVIEKVCPRTNISHTGTCKYTYLEDSIHKLEYAYVSQTGYYPDNLRKPNQDAVHVCEHFEVNGKQFACFGVYDGHGGFGDKCSKYVKTHLIKNLKADPDFLNGKIEIGLTNAFLKTNSDMHKLESENFDDQMSGTTAIVLLLSGDTIYCANVGDSRAISCIEHEGKFITVPFSIDQTPFRKDERERVKACGARVLTTAQLIGEADSTIQEFGTEEENDGDPPRVWHAVSKYPGTAFTRSIGDRIAEELGVNAIPEIFRRKIESYDKYLVIASDGVFEFLSSQTVADIIQEHLKNGNILGACQAVVMESYRLWLQYEVRTDDISVIIVDVTDISRNLRFQGRRSLFTRSNSSAIRHLASEIMAQKRILEENTTFPDMKSGISENNQIITTISQEWTTGMRPVRRKVTSRKGKVKFNLSDLIGYSLPVYDKSSGEQELIADAIQSNFLFSHLNDEQMKDAVLAMEVQSVNAGEVIIKQFDVGDKFYIVKSGKYIVEVAIPDDSDDDGDNGPKFSAPQVVMEYDSSLGNHPSFGELALMYDNPRAATVTAITDGELWSLERNAFRSICMKTPYHETLRVIKKIDIFESLTNSNISRLVDKASQVSFKPNEYVVRQGEVGNAFYIVKGGRAEVTIKDEDSGEERLVMKLNQNDYFGERSLITDAPRAASVLATEQLECLCITRDLFNEILGPLHEEIYADAEKRERISELVNSDISLDHLIVYRKPICTNTEAKMYYCQFRGDVQDKSRFATVRVIDKDFESKESDTIKQEADILAHLSTPFLISVFWDSFNRYELFKDEIILQLPLNLKTSQTLKFVLKSVCSAIIHLHQRKIVHRSICPDALFIDIWGDIKVFSYNCAKIMDESRTYTLCGIPDYIAPEMIRNVGYGFSVDWWSLGMTAFELCSGRTLCSAENEVKVYELISSLTDGSSSELIDASDFSQGFEDAKPFIKRLIRIDPKDRPNYEFEHELQEESYFDKLSSTSPFLQLIKESRERVLSSGEFEPHGGQNARKA